MENTSPKKFFLYARKSTDVEDKQVLSIDAQLTELHAFAKTEGLNVIEELVEKQSAKIPGRPVFNKMLDRIERGEANGIVSWNPGSSGAQFCGRWTHYLSFRLRSFSDVEVSNLLGGEHKPRKIYAQHRLWAKQILH